MTILFALFVCVSTQTETNTAIERNKEASKKEEATAIADMQHR